MTLQMRFSLPIAVACALVSGCVASKRFVRVAVLDQKTRAPVSGAKVTTSYYPKPLLPFLQRPESTAITDKSGTALLQTDYSRKWVQRPDVSYWVEVNDKHYHSSCLSGASMAVEEKILARAPDAVPSAPDLEVTISSREDQARYREAMERQEQAVAKRAAHLFQRAPHYWPQSEPASFSDVDRKLLENRWASASAASLGTPADEALIRTAILAHLQHRGSSVTEVKWLSPGLVMAYAGWQTDPEASAVYWYVLGRQGEEWKVIAHYLLVLS